MGSGEGSMFAAVRAALGCARGAEAPNAGCACGIMWSVGGTPPSRPHRGADKYFPESRDGGQGTVQGHRVMGPGRSGLTRRGAGSYRW